MKRKTRAERAVRSEVKKKPLRGARRPKHSLKIYTLQDGHSIRDSWTVRSWGELIDAINSYAGIPIEEIHMECNV